MDSSILWGNQYRKTLEEKNISCEKALRKIILSQKNARMVQVIAEQKMNIVEQDDALVNLPITSVLSAQVDIRFSDEDNIELNDSIVKLFKKGSNFFWPYHPNSTPELIKTKLKDRKLNSSEKEAIENSLKILPFRSLNTSASHLSGYKSASRSITIYNDLGKLDLSIKLPTIKANEWEPNPKKVDLRKSVIHSISRSKHINKIDKMRNFNDQNFVILKEAVSFVDKETQNGFIVKDWSPLGEDGFWIPAFSLPLELGAELAVRSKITHREILKEMSDLIATAKAKILVRYGLLTNFPHLQNFLIHFDNDLNLSGKIAWRDISDSFNVPYISNLIDSEMIEFEEKVGKSKNWPFLDFQADFSTNLQGYEVPSNITEADSTFNHVLMVVKEIEDELEVKIRLDTKSKDQKIIQKQLRTYFRSTEGIEAIKNYHKRFKRI